MKKIFENIVQLYERHKRFVPAAAFLGGFAWDNLTLGRIDRMSDNLILLSYILLLAALIILANFVDRGRIQTPFLLRYREWYPVGMQFFLGGLFSSYVVFYFQSASFTKTSVFLIILVVLLVANEFLHDRFANLYLIFSLYFLATFSFFIFFIPVVIKIMNVYTFILGGVLSLLLVGGMLFLFHKKAILTSRNQMFLVATPVLILYLLLNLFYWQNWMPPVPLSLKTAGVYHHASKDHRSDAFVLQYEKPQWYQFWKSSDKPFRYAPGDTVHCFTAVFAPTRLSKKIFHHWQKYFENRQSWVTTDRLGYEITGYRDGGYRGYTRKVNVSPGKWRIDVETDEGLLLGRVDFEIKDVKEKVPLKTVHR